MTPRIQIPATLLLIASSFPAIGVGVGEIERELRADHQAWSSARADFDTQLAAGRLNEQEQSDYIRYIESLGDRVQESCARFQSSGGDASVHDALCSAAENAKARPASIDISAERTLGERSADVDAELRSSLGGFDEMLLLEQRRVRAKADAAADGAGASGGGGASGRGTDGAGSATSVANSGRGGSKGSGRGGAEKGTGRSGGPGRGPGGDDRSGSERFPAGDTQGAEVAGAPSRGGGAGPGGGERSGEKPDVPADIPDGSDDDVVARQLREAAENEKDPELRKRLWEEYRRYKAG
ncbi:MAG: hypothetical protein ACPGUC_06455 [Gammaproteobacteria bacterium]